MAGAMVIAALLPRELDDRRLALQQLARVSGGKALPSIAAAARALQSTPELAHWPALLNLLPELNAIDGAERTKLLTIVRFLSRPPNGPHILRYCVMYLLEHGSDQAPAVATLKLTDCTAAIATLIAALAHAGDGDPACAALAYDAGLCSFLPSTLRPVFRQPGAQWMSELDAAFAQLRTLHPVNRKTLTAALAATAGHDGMLTVPEAQLLRLACWVLNTPLPALPVVPHAPRAVIQR
jgi:hypothetical protein